MNTNDERMREYVREMIRFIGDDPDREGLRETPARVVRSWAELFCGYSQACSEVTKVFDFESDQLVVLRDIKFYSMCEHHILPFYGVCHIAYIPDGKKVLGVSKLARMVEVFARRLQLQERLTAQIAEGIKQAINPSGVAVFIEAQHLCMMMRGAKQQTATMRTQKILGAFMDNAAARAEMQSLMRLGA